MICTFKVTLKLFLWNFKSLIFQIKNCFFKGPLGVESTCQGDSGGPLVVNTAENRQVDCPIFDTLTQISFSGMSLSVQLALVCPHARVLTRQCSHGESEWGECCPLTTLHHQDHRPPVIHPRGHGAGPHGVHVQVRDPQRPLGLPTPRIDCNLWFILMISLCWKVFAVRVFPFLL